MSAPLIPVRLVTASGQPLGDAHMRADTAQELGIGRYEMIGPEDWSRAIEGDIARNLKERKQ